METILNLQWLAMAPTPQGTESTAPGWVSFMPFILIFVIFYLILIRPQKKQQREHQQLMDGLKNGDQILMSNGIYGTIVDSKEKTLTVKVADNVRIKVLRSAVAQLADGENKKETAAAAAK